MGRCEEWSEIFESFSELFDFEARLVTTEGDAFFDDAVQPWVKRNFFNEEKSGAVRAFEDRVDFEKDETALFQRVLPWEEDEALKREARVFFEEESFLKNRSNKEIFEELFSEEESFLKCGGLFEEEELAAEGEDAIFEKIRFFYSDGGRLEALVERDGVSGKDEIKRQIIKMSGNEERKSFGDIKVEMITRAEEKSETDIDMIIELLGERIRDEMSRGAEGWYL